MARQRELTTFEMLDFLGRNPVTAARVAETKTMLFLGTYSFDPTGWNIPGVIPPWGDSLTDVLYGNVVIYPAPDGTIHYSSNVPDAVAAQVTKPLPKTVPFNRTMLDDLSDTVKTWGFWIVGGIVGYYILTHQKPTPKRR